MPDWKGYECLEIGGNFLIPGFSIYLLEIKKDDKRFFYIGMTGDPFYPSARGAIYRLAGHLEKPERSTQNQLWKALRDTVGIKTSKDLASLEMRMHYFPIEGFKEWIHGNLHYNNVKANRETKEYREYKSMQDDVLQLENALINKFNGKLMNKTGGVEAEILAKYENICESINKIING